MKLTQQQKDFIRQNEQHDIRELALKLDKEKYRELNIEFVLTQISGRQTAKEKFPACYTNDGIIYPAHLSLEQASSETTANYKVSLIPEDGLHNRFTWNRIRNFAGWRVTISLRWVCGALQ